MDRLASEPRALESYLRFSYMPGEDGLLVEGRIAWSEIRFTCDSTRKKYEYLTNTWRN